MIGIIFSALFLGFYRAIFPCADSQTLLDTILMTALAVMVFVPVLILAAAVRLYAAFLRLRPWACPSRPSGNECGQSWRRVDHGVSYGSAFSGCPTRECWHGMVQPVFRPAQCRCGY